MVKPPFEIVMATKETAEIHSDYALQFSIKDSVKSKADEELKTAIRNAVKCIRQPSGEILNGAYVTGRCDTYDAENLVFYNVGITAFRKLDAEGVRFETERTQESRLPRAHCWTYRLVRPESPFSRWKLLDPPAAKWRDVPLQARPRSVSRAGHFWLAMRETVVDWDRSQHLTGLFGLRLRLASPPKSLIHLCGPMKPMFDGVIAGLHSYPGEVSDLLLDRLAKKIGPIVRSHDRILDHLRIPGVLGPCPGLFRLKGSAFWHPRDEDCVAGELRLVEGSSPEWRLSGEIYPVVGLHDNGTAD
jgi:hypothetical protein